MHGKKYVVISQEEYQRLKDDKPQENLKLVNPEKRDLQKSNVEMKNVLDGTLPSDEKVRLLTEELNNLKARYDELRKPKPLEVLMKNENVKRKRRKRF